MTYENILFEKDGAVGILKVNRPKSLNALNPPTVREIAACLAEVQQDQSIRCLIITGAGDRAFVAGADIAAMVSMNALEGKAFSALGLGAMAPRPYRLPSSTSSRLWVTGPRRACR